MLSMMRRMAEWADPQPVRLFLGVGTDGEVPKLSELAEAGAQLTDFAVTTSVWQPGPGLDGHGRLAGRRASPRAAHGSPPDVYVCGPPAMVDAAAEVARVNGVDDEHLILREVSADGRLNSVWACSDGDPPISIESSPAAASVAVSRLV